MHVCVVAAIETVELVYVCICVGMRQAERKRTQHKCACMAIVFKQPGCACVDLLVGCRRRTHKEHESRVRFNNVRYANRMTLPLPAQTCLHAPGLLVLRVS